MAQSRLSGFPRIRPILSRLAHILKLLSQKSVSMANVKKVKSLLVKSLRAKDVRNVSPKKEIDIANNTRVRNKIHLIRFYFNRIRSQIQEEPCLSAGLFLWDSSKSMRKEALTSSQQVMGYSSRATILFSKTSPETSPEPPKRVQKRVQLDTTLDIVFVHLNQLIG